MSGKLGYSGLGAFKLGDSASTAAAEHVCFTYGGDDAATATSAGAGDFTYDGDDAATTTYGGKC